LVARLRERGEICLEPSGRARVFGWRRLSVSERSALRSQPDQVADLLRVQVVEPTVVDSTRAESTPVSAPRQRSRDANVLHRVTLKWTAYGWELQHDEASGVRRW
jgi:hypothetical protein